MSDAEIAEEFAAAEEPCPVCGEELNHIVPNGYRNEWDHSTAKVAVCTTETSDWMYVHVTEVVRSNE